MFGDDRIVDGHEFGAVRERAFDLNLVHQFGHAVHHLRASEELAAKIHQLGDAASVPDELEDLSRDEGDGLRMIQPQSARQPLLCEKTRLMQRQLVEFAGGKVHG